MSDGFAPLKDNAWRELADLDARLERGEIDEERWHREIQALIVPAYLGAETPWAQSGKTGTFEDWEYSRNLVADALDHDGTFLDVGCANGFLMECVVRWSRFAVEPYGLELSPELAELARRRLPSWADRIFVGNALEWTPDRTFDYIRTELGYVPRHRQRELVERLLGSCRRLIIGVFNEEVNARPTEELVRSWGYRIAGRSERAHRRHEEIDYRVFWLDA